MLESAGKKQKNFLLNIRKLHLSAIRSPTSYKPLNSFAKKKERMLLIELLTIYNGDEKNKF